LNYRYVLEDDDSKAELWIYRFLTPSGRLQLTIVSTAERMTVTSDLSGAPSREVVAMAEPAGLGEGDVELSWPDLKMRARYVKHEGTNDLERAEGWMPDCESIVGGTLALTKRDLLEQVRTDFLLYVEPPQHLEMLMAALYAARYLPIMAGECEDSAEPMGGSCYYDNLGYFDCTTCCESYRGVTMSVCGGVLGRFCRGPWCLKVGLGVCGGALTLGSNICSVHNCRGKPGDPNCDEDQVCEGHCMNFCGPGWSSGCGQCDSQAPNHQACCR